VVQPNHPLAGQVVKVMSQTVHPAYDERCWIIEMTDQTWAKIPLSWAVVVDDTTESGSSVVETVCDGLWVDIAGLLDLVNMVRHLTTDQTEEAAKDERFTDLTPVEQRQPAEHYDRRAPPLGAVVSGASTGDGPDPGDDIDAATDVAAATAYRPETAGGEV
jgi:hypothetical protein